jgi:putative permease
VRTIQPRQVRVVNLRSLVFWALAAYAFVHLLDAIAVTVIVFAIAIFLAIVLDPPIRWLDRHGLSRGMSVGLIAIGLLLTIGLTGYLAVPPLVRQGNTLARDAPGYLQKLQSRVEEHMGSMPFLRDEITTLDPQQAVTTVGQRLLPQIGRFSLTFLSGLFSLLMVIIIGLYSVANPKPLVRGVVMALPQDYRRTALRVLVRLSKQFQGWVRATFWMMLIVGVMCGVGLWALGVKPALLFGLIAGIGEAIPTIGPILSAVPPILVTFADDPMKALWVALLYLVVQQIENNLLVPRIMASTLNLHSVSVLFFVIAMGALMGPVGILLATPLCVTVKVLYEEVYRKHVLRRT